jgi:5-methylcytosine-specific restriction endonuclease McrA
MAHDTTYQASSPFGIANCAICNTPFSRNATNHKYCSPKCARIAVQRQAEAERKPPPERRACVICGIEYQPVAHHQKYCSTDCREIAQANAQRQAHQRRKKLQLQTVIGRQTSYCLNCKQPLPLDCPTHQKYCSAACREHHRAANCPPKAKRTIECPVCGKQITTSNPRKKYCSQQCSQKAASNRRKGKHSNGEKSYRQVIVEYLKGRDGDFCCYCGVRHESYHIDHYIPLDNGGPNRMENLRLACQRCNTSKGSQMPFELVQSSTFGFKD